MTVKMKQRGLTIKAITKADMAKYTKLKPDLFKRLKLLCKKNYCNSNCEGFDKDHLEKYVVDGWLRKYSSTKIKTLKHQGVESCCANPDEYANKLFGSFL